MKKINWGNLFEIMTMLGAICIGFGILFFGFQFIWQFLKSIF